MKYHVSAMVVYYDEIEADSGEEAIDMFCADCPYDIDGETIECEQDFDSWWETLDDIEREEYMRAMAERSEE